MAGGMAEMVGAAEDGTEEVVGAKLVGMVGAMVGMGMDITVALRILCV
jgi:hypothetical protein